MKCLILQFGPTQSELKVWMCSFSRFSYSDVWLMLSTAMVSLACMWPCMIWETRSWVVYFLNNLRNNNWRNVHTLCNNMRWKGRNKNRSLWVRLKECSTVISTNQNYQTRRWQLYLRYLMSRPSTLGSIISSQVRCWEIMIVCFDTNNNRNIIKRHCSNSNICVVLHLSNSFQERI